MQHKWMCTYHSDGYFLDYIRLYQTSQWGLKFGLKGHHSEFIALIYYYFFFSNWVIQDFICLF